ncbi:hypothetical protein [Paraburkholderia acidiphila]|uniref:Uncharacterized protein n=1 Tax=Paraburkholderia acidiphila TaxID=2571747 RepID=A0A7Z2GCU0_9BURK|nr:hypothetical protein [Paraburkholderia acidiphila]QGZ59358.1 hypothetical protein FAZ97_30610 [Paraburkholderia acidiphila]
MRTPRFWSDEHERKRWEHDELERQRDEDRGDFYRYFRPKDDLRTITGQRGLQTIQEYLSDILDFAHWNLPQTNDDVRRVLCDVVRSGRLVPYMDREWTQRPRVFRLTPAPQFRQSASASGGGNANRPLTWDEWLAFKAAQEGKTAGAGSSLPETLDVPSQVTKAAPGLTQAASSAASTSEGGGGSLGFVESAAGALVGVGEGNLDDDDTGSDDGRTFGDDLFSANSGADSTPLGDAQPFEYNDDWSGSDATDFAARGVSENDEAECFDQYQRDMDECTAYRSAMGGQRFIDACSQRAFQNYQQCRGY